jgi:hypothetical protein
MGIFSALGHRWIFVIAGVVVLFSAVVLLYVTWHVQHVSTTTGMLA